MGQWINRPFDLRENRKTIWTANLNNCRCYGNLQKKDEPIVENPTIHHHHHPVKRVKELISELVGLRMFNRAAFSIEKALVKRASKKVVSKSGLNVTAKVIERVIQKSGKRIGLRVLQRIGRGVVLSVPILGGALAVHSARSDYKRFQQEKQLFEMNGFENGCKQEKTFKYFWKASILNGIDAILNCGMVVCISFQEKNDEAYQGLIYQVLNLSSTFSHDPLEALLVCLEMGSISAAVCATAMAILGEINSAESSIEKEINQLEHDASIENNKENN